MCQIMSKKKVKTYCGKNRPLSSTKAVANNTANSLVPANDAAANETSWAAYNASTVEPGEWLLAVTSRGPNGYLTASSALSLSPLG